MGRSRTRLLANSWRVSEAASENAAPPLETTVQGVLDGSASVEQLVSALDSTRDVLESMRDQFRATAQAEPEPNQQAIYYEIEAVEQSFRDYFTVLDSCSGYLKDFERVYLENASAHLQAAAERLNLDFLRFREAALAQRGPTTHPGLNHLYSLVSQVLAAPADEAAQAALAQQKLVEEVRCQSTLDSLDVDAELAPLAGYTQTFYTDYAELLAGETPLEEWPDRLSELGRSFARIDVKFLARGYGAGPTAVPPLNLVINSAWLLSQQAIEPEVVQVFLGQAGAVAQAAADSHQQMLLSLNDNDPNRPEALQISESFQGLAEALDAYWSWLENPDPAALEGLFQLAQRHAAGVQAAFQAMNTKTSGAGASCPICGLVHSAGETRCRQCGVALESAQSFATLEGEGTAAGGLAGASRFLRLVEAAEHLLNYNEGEGALLGLLDEMDKAMELARKSQPAEAESESLSQAAQTYGEGLEEVGAALDRLREFAKDPDRELLEEIRASLDAAAHKLQNAQQELAPLTGAAGT